MEDTKNIEPPTLVGRRTLIAWRPPPLLNFGEQLLFLAAGKDGFRGLQFQQSLLFGAVVRSFGVPSRILFGESNYSSWRRPSRSPTTGQQILNY